MKKFRKILGIVMIFILVLSMVPQKASSISSAYDPYEAGRLQTFLNQSSAMEGKSNGQALNPAYNADEPSTWSGITWSDSAPMYVTKIDWAHYLLAGALDVGGFTRLNSLLVYDNQLSSINVAGDTALAEFDCSGNEITSFVLEGAVNITEFDCSDNMLSSLSVGELTKLKVLECDYNQIGSLDVSNNTDIGSLRCNNNLITELNLNGAVNLNYLYCEYNHLTYLDLRSAGKLSFLDCDNNQITSMDVSFCPYITKLVCHNNQLSSLNLTGTGLLYYLDCGYNQLTSLDFSASHCYTEIYCNNNLLTSLDLDTESELYYVDCTSNQLRSVSYSLSGGVEVVAIGDGYVSLRCEYGEGQVYVRAYAEPMIGASFQHWSGVEADYPTMPVLPVNLEEDKIEVEAHFTKSEIVTPVPTSTPISPIPSSTPTPTPTTAPSAPTPTPAPMVEYCIVNFDLVGGTRVGGGQLIQYVLPGDSAAAPEAVKDGYIFIGWDSSLDHLKKSITIKAQWEDINAFHKVTFDLNGGYRTGGGELVQKVADSSAAAAPEVSYDEYNFMGWDKAFDNVKENLTVSAKWEIAIETVNEPYTVTYDSNGGEGTAPVDGNDYLIGDKAVLADEAKLTMEGYEIAGWSYEADGDVITDSSITVTGDITLYAVWVPVEIIPEPTEAPIEAPIEEPDTEVVPAEEPDTEDIPKTGVSSETYLGIMMLTFGAGLAAFEIRKRKRTKNA